MQIESHLWEMFPETLQEELEPVKVINLTWASAKHTKLITDDSDDVASTGLPFGNENFNGGSIFSARKSYSPAAFL